MTTWQDLSTATWRRSSRSGGNGGQCVELALIGACAAARDSKNAEGDVLIFGENALAFFLNATKTGRF